MTEFGYKSLSLEEMIGQLFFIGIPGDKIDSTTASLLEDIKPGGICLFARNIKEAEQTRRLLEEIRDKLSVEPFLSIDQEGGLVDRLRRVLAPMPSAAKVTTIADAEELAKVIADALLALGFNMDFAPVVDVIDRERHRFVNGLHSRAFGSSALEVVQLAGAFMETLQENSVIGCLKHFPGLGASEVDSHDELPVVPVGQEDFEAVDLYPYRRLIAAGSVKVIMVAHAVYPKLGLQETDQNGKLLPSSLSSNFVTTLLRQNIGFDGLVLTDDLEMGAIVKNYGIGEASVKAILAGNDMVCICAGVDNIREAHKAVTDAFVGGSITKQRLDDSLSRIFELRSSVRMPAKFDADQMRSLTERITTMSQRLASN